LVLGGKNMQGGGRDCIPGEQIRKRETGRPVGISSAHDEGGNGLPDVQLVLTKEPRDWRLSQRFEDKGIDQANPLSE